MNVGVLASGTGTNLQALIDRAHGREGVVVRGVASDKPGARALQRAREAGIDAEVFPGDASGGREARDAAMVAWLRERDVELVVLAGYMQLVSDAFLAAFPKARDQRAPVAAARLPGAGRGAAGDRLRGQGIRGQRVLRRRRRRHGAAHPAARGRAARRHRRRDRAGASCTRSSTSCSSRRCC